MSSRWPRHVHELPSGSPTRQNVIISDDLLD
jgi:hypothetical protein